VSAQNRVKTPLSFRPVGTGFWYPEMLTAGLIKSSSRTAYGARDSGLRSPASTGWLHPHLHHNTARLCVSLTFWATPSRVLSPG
jgi:hypothetical protein